MKKMIFATLVAVMGLYSCSKTELANTSNPLPMPENVAANRRRHLLRLPESRRNCRSCTKTARHGSRS